MTRTGNRYSAPLPARPRCPWNAYRSGDKFFICLDLPGIKPDSIDLTVEQNVLTLTIPVREAAKPRPIQITSGDGKKAVTA